MEKGEVKELITNAERLYKEASTHNVSNHSTFASGL
ncbi:MAG: hypothetical protein AOA65_1796 [Candidatus Bathyarchaeota archaeon BA1]|nr:MAG: hypothetical protein AOA65_1796 [Candidatus Bathyarchaeota archaeon BA1]